MIHGTTLAVLRISFGAMEVGATPFEVEGLVDLPIKFADNPLKMAQLLDLSGR